MTELYLENPQDYLHLEYRLKKERRPAYSLRAFARDLQMSSTSLVDVMKGKQGLSEERARTVAKILKWSPERYNHFWTLLQANFAADVTKKKQAQKIIKQKLNELKTHLPLEKFKVIADWQHVAILTYLQMHPDGSTIQDICEALDFSQDVSKDALERMIKLQLVSFIKSLYIALADNVHSGGSGPSEAIRSSHHQILDQAHKALEIVPIDDRENISIVYSIEQGLMPAIHKDIRKAIVGVLTEYSQRSKDDSVQVLTLHMFPVSKKKGSLK